ncbi:MAG: DUF4388 domain-containing protein [Thermoanaerobaculia bacterium]|nr:MAG: DUF4388 domain-containing protein [Thermoanaerobaculia bacterium]
MSISGSLEDVAVGDVIQFIHLGKRTGTLELERDGEQARFGFHDGSLIAARSPGAPRLGELLLADGRIDAATLETAMARQAAGGGQRSLGRLLLEAGAIDNPTLQSTVRRQLELAVEKVLSWDRGNFDFALDELRPIDDIGMATTDFLPEEELPANVVLLEAARIFDERDRHGHPLGVAEATEAAIDSLIEEPQPAGAAGPGIRVLTPDRELFHALRDGLIGRARLRRVALGRASEPGGPDDSDILLVDTRANALDPEALSLLGAAQVDSRLVVLVDSAEGLQAAYRSGAAAAVPGQTETVLACLLNLLSAPATERRTLPPISDTGVRRLQRVFGELRSGLASATVALNLMQLVSESFERALLLLVKRQRLAALGAFGTAADGRPLAVAARRLELAPEGLLAQAIATSRVHTARFAEAGLPATLASALGSPRNDEIVVFPVAGTERVIAVVYADNGDLAQPLRDVDLLEVATAQVGIAFENELLRRQLGRSAS